LRSTKMTLQIQGQSITILERFDTSATIDVIFMSDAFSAALFVSTLHFCI
jgi:hypothetical protein